MGGKGCMSSALRGALLMMSLAYSWGVFLFLLLCIRLLLYTAASLERLSIPTSVPGFGIAVLYLRYRCLSGIMVNVRPLVTELDGFLYIVYPFFS